MRITISSPRTPPPEHVIAPAPDVVIGEAGGDESQQLFRVVGVALLADGTTVVANAGTSELRFYSPTGELYRRVGGAGGGPGEFRRMDAMRRVAGDTLLVWDELLQRVSFFTADGSLARYVSVAQARERLPRGIFGAPVGSFPDGSLLMPVVRRVERLDVRTTDTLVLYRVHAGGAGADSLLAIPGLEQVMARYALRPSLIIRWAPPFGRDASVRVLGGAMYTIDGVDAEVRVSDTAGVVRQIWRGGGAARSVSRAQWRDMIRDSMASGGNQYHSTWEEAMTTLGPPEVTPAFRRLLPADDRTVWAERTRLPGEQAVTFVEFDSTGLLRRTIGSAQPLRVLDARNGRVVALEVDDLGVESVRVHRVDPPARR